MHAITHSLAHRAQAPATRARARCPPQYHHHYALPSARSTPTTPAYLTPASSSCSSIPTPTPSTKLARASAINLPHPSASTSSSTNTPAAPSTAHRNRFASALVDLAVKSLCDLWPLHIIPAVFAANVPPRARSEHVSGPFAAPVPQHPPPSQPPTQLPSPPSSPGTESEPSFDNDGMATAATMRGFVIEVLRRSRTSTSVLQTALCYLDVIQPKVAALAALEREGAGMRGEEDQGHRLVLASDPAALEPETTIEELLNPSSYDANPPPTAATEYAQQSTEAHSQILPPPSPAMRGHLGKKPRTDPAMLDPLPLLPSPLLDPRRAFIAALVLASKFAQDKCYSNRAWAKLAGLSAREIGRCERALGDALEWRLWVGKKAVAPSARPFSRTKSEGHVLMPSPEVPDQYPGNERPLRRSSTLPATNAQASTSGAIFAMPPIVPAPYLRPPPTSEALPFATTMQGPWMPTMSSPPQPPPSQTLGPWLEPTPQLSASPATTESSVDEQRTVQLFDLPEMPPPGVMDVDAKMAPVFGLPLQSSMGSFGSDGGIVALGWGGSQEWAWGVVA